MANYNVVDEFQFIEHLILQLVDKANNREIIKELR